MLLNYFAEDNERVMDIILYWLAHRPTRVPLLLGRIGSPVLSSRKDSALGTADQGFVADLHTEEDGFEIAGDPGDHLVVRRTSGEPRVPRLSRDSVAELPWPGAG